MRKQFKLLPVHGSQVMYLLHHLRQHEGQAHAAAEKVQGLQEQAEGTRAALQVGTRAIASMS